MTQVVEPPVQSRFKILPRPILSPGHCLICGKTDVRVLDFGVESIEDQRVYICIDDCLRQAAQEALGMVDGQALAVAQLLARSATAQRDQAGSIVEHYRDRISDLHSNLLFDLGNLPYVDVPEHSVESASIPDESNRPKHGTVGSSVGNKLERKDASVKSSDESRPASIPANSGNDGDFPLFG